MRRRTRRSRPSREPEPTPSPGRAELEDLLGRERLDTLITRAREPGAGALRAAIEELADELMGSVPAARLTRAKIDEELRTAQRIQRTLVALTQTSLEGWQ